MTPQPKIHEYYLTCDDNLEIPEKNDKDIALWMLDVAMSNIQCQKKRKALLKELF